MTMSILPLHTPIMFLPAGWRWQPYSAPDAAIPPDAEYGDMLQPPSPNSADHTEFKLVPQTDAECPRDPIVPITLNLNTEFELVSKADAE